MSIPVVDIGHEGASPYEWRRARGCSRVRKGWAGVRERTELRTFRRSWGVGDGSVVKRVAIDGLEFDWLV